jgi:chromosome segregation ATPase
MTNLIGEAKPIEGVTGLTSQVSDILSIVEDLRRQLLKQRKLNSSLKLELEGSNNAHHETNELSNKKTIEITSLNTELANLQATHEKLTIEYGAAEKARSDLVGEMRHISGDFQGARDTIDERDAEITSLKNARLEASEENSRVVDEIQARVDKLTLTLVEADQAIEDANERHSIDTLTINNLNDNKTSLNANIKLLEERCAGVDKIRETLLAVRQDMSEDE